ncbi:MAG TPA: lipocalin family protein [Chitinophagaceae bacterium]|nr:lipocalin family protein [Chitinophagaceae bacterium]
MGFSCLLLIALTTGLVSCDKEDSQNQSTRERQLTAREWRITDITRKKVTNTTQDSSILKDCSADDRLSFTAGKAFNFKDNNTKCDTTIFQYDAGTWSLNSAQNVLSLAGGIRTQKWTILSMNDSLMNVEWLDSIAPTNKVLKTIKLKNK